MSFKIETTSDFEKEAKKLAKKYASFKSDYAKLIESLKDNPLQGTELCPGVRKIRMQIKSKGKGKSGGARVITFNLLVNNQNGDVVLLLLYDKENTSTVDINVIKQILEDLDL